ncbi:hypothetical protein CCP3SC15_3570002 [Gammaproteobacteria bacterium]
MVADDNFGCTPFIPPAEQVGELACLLASIMPTAGDLLLTYIERLALGYRAYRLPPTPPTGDGV